MTHDEATPPAHDADDRQKLRVAAFLGLALLLSLRGDGRFPLPASLPEATLQLLLLPYTAALGALVWLYFRPPRLVLRAVPWPRLALLATLTLEAAFLAVLALAARKYAAFGYAAPPPIAYLVIAVAAAAFLVAAVRSADPSRLLAASVRTYGLGQVLSLVYFPLHAGRSDMLPLIGAACQRLLAGVSPYGWYELPHRVPLTYLPGTWLPFLPAAALGLDPRAIELGAIVAAVVVAYRATTATARPLTALLLSLFLLDPYLQYRHEIYLGPLWLALALSFAALRRARPVRAGIAFGWAMATSQFAWVLAPFFFLHLAGAYTARRALAGAAAALAVAVVLVAPFLLRSPGEFMAGVFGHWQGTATATTANLSYWVLRVVPARGLTLVQACAVLAIVALAWRRLRSLTACAAWMSLALLVFILLNPLIWVYFYLTVLFLMVLSAASLDRATEAGYDALGSGTTPGGAHVAQRGRTAAQASLRRRRAARLRALPSAGGGERRRRSQHR